MKTIFVLLALILQTSIALAEIHGEPTKADLLATATFREQRHHPWPFALLSIGHNMQSYQDYSMSPYWHDGLDIRCNQNETVHAAAGGTVVNIENYVSGNSLYWEVAILDDEGFVWKYHHIDEPSITQEIKDAYKSKKIIKAGTVIGKTVTWPEVSFGEVYNHLHLQVVAKDKKYTNPFLMLEPLNDNQVPVINKIGIARNHRPTDLTEVKGPHSLFVDASDLTLHHKFILPPYKISYVMDGKEEKVVWEFINLPGLTSDEKFITDFYLDGTCGNYQCRKFYFNLNFTPENPRGQLNLPAGEHSIEVTVEDIVGNKTSKSFSWTVL
jgi:hypothetical protein